MDTISKNEKLIQDESIRKIEELIKQNNSSQIKIFAIEDILLKCRCELSGFRNKYIKSLVSKL